MLYKSLIEKLYNVWVLFFLLLVQKVNYTLRCFPLLLTWFGRASLWLRMVMMMMVRTASRCVCGRNIHNHCKTCEKQYREWGSSVSNERTVWRDENWPKKENKKLIKQSTNLLVSCLRIDSKLKNWKHKKFITKINFVQDLIGIWRLRLRAFLSFINVISIYSIIIINKIQDYMKVWVKGMWHYHDYQPPIPWISAVRLLINFSVSMVNAWELDIEVSENW